MGTADGRRPRSDPLIKVFDLRMMRQIAPLQLYANRGPPPLVSFLPQFSSSLVIAKPDAQLQVTTERVTRESDERERVMREACTTIVYIM